MQRKGVCQSLLIATLVFVSACRHKDSNASPWLLLLVVNGWSVEAPRDPFARGAITSPNGGYIDSIFINPTGDRIYFLHSIKSVNDFMTGGSAYPTVEPLTGHTSAPGLEWNSDLYFIEWDGASWSAPRNLGGAADGSSINSPGNECCMWLNDSETEIIFYRDTFDLGALGPRGNFRATRASRNEPWSAPVLLPGDYGSGNQSSTVYRHDIHKTASGDLYLWEHDAALANKGRLLYGKWNGAGWDGPVGIAAADSSDDETQPWVSRDERCLLFNRRDSSGNTSLMRMVRASAADDWGPASEVPIHGIADSNGRAVWGEPTLPSAEGSMLFIRFETDQLPWKARMMFSAGQAAQGFGTPIPLN